MRIEKSNKKGTEMNIITPRYSSYQTPKTFKDKGRGTYYQSNPSFKGSPQTLIAGADKKVLDVFKRYYGGVSDRMGKKLYSLITPPKNAPKAIALQSKRLIMQ